MTSFFLEVLLAAILECGSGWVETEHDRPLTHFEKEMKGNSDVDYCLTLVLLRNMLTIIIIITYNDKDYSYNRNIFSQGATSPSGGFQASPE